jgi:glycosyltransferase involved in cell wall biosynthesis
VHIGLLTTSFPRHPGDYAGSFVGDRAAQLVSGGHQVDVLAAGAPGHDPPSPGLSVTRLPSGAPLFYGAGAPESLEASRAAWLAAAAFTTALASTARLRAPGWELLESHWLVPCALAASAGAPGHPRRAWAHSGDVALLERLPFGRTVARRLARDGTDLRFVTADLRARFAALAGTAAGTVEPLPVPAALFAPAVRPDPAARARLGLARPTVLAVGRLVPIKGHDRLLRASALAAARGCRADVVILGDGPERARLAQLAEHLGVSLRLPGFVPRPEVAAWMRAADLFALPSVRLPNGRTEGAPTTLREARAIGIPAVATPDLTQLAQAIQALTPPARDM